jgi:uncharacterized membrane protein YdbT with pleckstrin-like domain
MTSEPFDFMAFKRPVKALASYYLLISLFALPAFPIVWLVRMCKYWTLEYDFDEEGISMKWGVLWRREIHLTYRRIQDIHLTRNVLQRWMSLANVSVQTAGGSSGPEMVIEGAPDPEALRDALYSRMRGSGEHVAEGEEPTGSGEAAEAEESAVIELLLEIRDLLKARN